jgi:DNA-binding transcriptional regulator YdaS (Cro superfamily)
MDLGIEKAAAAAGTVAELARRLEITRAAIHQWSRIPAERVIEVERVTGPICAPRF